MNALKCKKPVVTALILVMLMILANQPLSAARQRRGATVEVTMTGEGATGHFYIRPFSSGSAWGDQGRERHLPFKMTGERKFYLMNLSLGIGAYLREHHDLSGTLGLGFSLSYIGGRNFFGARLVSAAFMDGGGRDLSLLYGRAWKSGIFLLSMASGIGLSAFDEIGNNDPNFGLPLDAKALVMSSKRGGVSLGIHGFAFLTAAYQYFGICLNLGAVVSNR